MRYKILLPPCLVLALLPVLRVRAQGTTRSPHGSLSLECTDCHTADRWTPVAKRLRFSHDKVGFPLEGSHAQASCRSCHRSLVFNHVGTSCLDCHKDPHKGELGGRCEACHTPKTWSNQLEIFKAHDRTRLPLFAIHARVDCESCHKGQRPTEFANTPTSCAVCHAKAAQQTKSPNHVVAGWTQRCEACHSAVASSWKPASFKHPPSFPLRGAHTAAKCDACHHEAFKGTPRDCVGCHLLDYNKAKNPNHLATGFPTTCGGCHRETGWRPASFTDHSRTRFPLTGAHQSVACAQCHAGGKFAGTPTDCYACHQANYQATKNPNHGAAGFPTTCASCHSTDAWRPASFTDHNKTRFPLTGRHQSVACAQCHVGGKFAGTPTDCYACHQASYQATKNPNHAASGFPTTCASCHSTNAWRPASFDHNRTKFPLNGAHQRADCTKCHSGGKFARLPTDCYACHQASYQATKNPNHAASGFPTTCASCHGTNAWRPASAVDHNKTRFPLTGRHQSVACAQCHVGGKFAGTSTDCYACHQVSYQATKNPNHAAAGIPTTCATCHTTNGWAPALFDHNRTRFPLQGAHQRVDCAQCHAGGKYTGTPSDCYSCHRAAYQASKNPNHVAGNFPTTCEGCHTVNGWRPATFSDHNRTRFPLTGRHVSVACSQCHVGGRFTGTPTDCYACHQAKYQATRSPNHVTAGLPTTCSTCHTTNAWTPASFNHSATRFPLAGAHTAVACAQCHVGGRFAGTPTDCYACHQANYQATKNPNHVAGNFPTTCNGCHTTNGWRPASFSDHNKTRFPLTGAHQSVGCAQCHVGGKYTGTPTDCYACHQAKYQATKNPNHVAAGFPTTCAGCHTTNAWIPASFNHSTTKFPLTGKHTTVTCAQCHVGGKYTGTPTDCYACHQAKYQATKNPNHVASGFPTTCASCHTTNGWTPASFNHSTTKFPLTGKHTTVTCAQCHVGGKYTGTPTDCYACHQAKYQATKNPNHVASGFPTTCAGCHTTNGWTPASFNHSTTKFPLTGKHTTVTCAQCHVGGKYTGTPTDCYACHQAKYQATKNPNHVAAGFPTTCASCHTTNGWTPATFNHTWFPTNHGDAKVCGDCHTTPNNYAAFECILCHAHSNKTQMDGKHRGRTGYSYASAACYRCHPRGSGG